MRCVIFDFNRLYLNRLKFVENGTNQGNRDISVYVIFCLAPSDFWGTVKLCWVEMVRKGSKVRISLPILKKINEKHALQDF
jgi:hypothetical protein